MNFLFDWGDPLKELRIGFHKITCGILFGLAKALASILDALTQLFFVFAGMTPVNGNVNSSNGSVEQIDIVNFFLQQAKFRDAYLKLCLVALALIVVFTIGRIIKQDYFDRSGPRSKGPIFRNVALSFIAFICIIPVFYFLVSTAGALALLVMKAMGYEGGGIGTTLFNMSFSDGGESFIAVGESISQDTVYDPNSFSWYKTDTLFHFWYTDDAFKWSDSSTGFFDKYNVNQAEWYWYTFFLGALIIFLQLLKMILAMLTRIYNLIALFIVAPAPISQIVLDEGTKFKAWKDKVVQESLKVVGCVMSFMLFMMIITSVGNLDLTYYINSDQAAGAVNLLENNSLTSELSNVNLLYFGGTSPNFVDTLVNSLGKVLLIIAGGGAIADIDQTITPFISGGSSSTDMGNSGKFVAGLGANAAKAVVGGVGKMVGSAAGAISSAASKRSLAKEQASNIAKEQAAKKDKPVGPGGGPGGPGGSGDGPGNGEKSEKATSSTGGPGSPEKLNTATEVKDGETKETDESAKNIETEKNIKTDPETEKGTGETAGEDGAGKDTGEAASATGAEETKDGETGSEETADKDDAASTADASTGEKVDEAAAGGDTSETGKDSSSEKTDGGDKADGADGGRNDAPNGTVTGNTKIDKKLRKNDAKYAKKVDKINNKFARKAGAKEGSRAFWGSIGKSLGSTAKHAPVGIIKTLAGGAVKALLHATGYSDLVKAAGTGYDAGKKASDHSADYNKEIGKMRAAKDGANLKARVEKSADKSDKKRTKELDNAKKKYNEKETKHLSKLGSSSMESGVGRTTTTAGVEIEATKNASKQETKVEETKNNGSMEEKVVNNEEDTSVNPETIEEEETSVVKATVEVEDDAKKGESETSEEAPKAEPMDKPVSGEESKSGSPFGKRMKKKKILVSTVKASQAEADTSMKEGSIGQNLGDAYKKVQEMSGRRTKGTISSALEACEKLSDECEIAFAEGGLQQAIQAMSPERATESMKARDISSFDDYKTDVQDRYKKATKKYSSAVNDVKKAATEYNSSSNPELLKKIEAATKAMYGASVEINGIKIELQDEDKK